MSGPYEISPAQLMRLIGTPDMPVLLDVRLTEDRVALPAQIPTAIAVDHTDTAALARFHTATHVVVICHKGKKLSHGTAALLRAAGCQAEVLDGGHVAWSKAGLPSTSCANLPATACWVTRQRPKIDRIACPWLIRRFVDPSAVFMFVPTAEVMDVANRFDATAFDTTDAPFRHVDGLCTFDAMIAHFGLTFPGLARLATVVRAADTGQHDLSEQAAGLLALSVGLSRLHRDDNVQLDAAMSVYDALYRWARDGFEETHSHSDVMST